ncbi:MAG: LLM class flavin-dependent oxidoreductase [Pseudomonadales bacterium]|nr:LLM class flavin-dependent oxidoreductase [Pseudomonadales bacterium]
MSLQVGVTAWEFGTKGKAVDLAKQGEIAEALGFNSFWLPESHFAGPSSIPAPLMLLATIAARTKTIRLGSTSYLLPIRHPIQAAEEVAVLDRLSNGRVILGIGRGFQDDIFIGFDVPVKDKRKLLKENLGIMIRAWQGEPIAMGKAPILLAPLPVQKPYPRIWVAAFGPLALKQAGTLGLPYIASPRESMSVLSENYTAHRHHVINAGHSPVTTIPVMRTIFISTRPALIKQVHNTLDTQSEAVDEWAIVGDEAFVADKLAEYQDALGLNYLIARGRIPGIESSDQIASHEALAKLTMSSRQS